MAPGSSKRAPVDVFVVGGGPAGAVAGGLLASWGRSVVIAHYGPTAPSLAESLPAGVRKLFGFLGHAELIDRAGFHPNQGNVSWWAGRETTATSDTPGYHVARDAFDRLLRQWARGAGVTLVNGCVRRVAGSGPFDVTCSRRTGGTMIHRAHVLLDCSGRAGVVARRGLRRLEAGYHTLAIIAEWNCPRWPDGERYHTVVESYRDGWAWSVPLSPRRRQCTVMIEPHRLQRSGNGLTALYAAELRKARHISERLAGARQVTPAWACDASLYYSSRSAESGVLLVGDAASFIEPLSSAGVKKALMSAWRAAVVANTSLEQPRMASIAYELHNRRELAVYTECLKRSAAFFRAACGVHADAYWNRRAGAWSQLTPSPPGDVNDADLAGDPAVRLAFDRIRGAGSLRLQAGTRLRFEPLASIEGREIVLREGVMLPGLDTPQRFAAGVNLPELVRLAPHCHDIPALVDAYRRRVGPVEPGALLAGLSLLVARRLLLASA